MTDRLRLALIAGGSAAVGAGVMWLLQGHSLRIAPSEMSYADFVAVLLTALSALVAVIALVFAIFALWGWSQFRRGVEEKISEITPGFLAEELQAGPTRRILDELVVDFFRAELASPGVAEAWAAEKQRRQAELTELDESPGEE